MKKVSAIVIFSLISMMSFAQGGSWYAGGQVGFGSESEDFGKNESTSAWSFSPEIGTFINNEWSAGIALGLNGSSTKDDDGDLESTSSFNPDIYVRRWFPAGEKLNLFVGLDLGFGSGTVTMYDQSGGDNIETEMSSFGTNVNLGVAYALAQQWTLLFKVSTLGYSSSSIGDDTTTTLGLKVDGNVTSNQFIFIGLYWTFSEK